MARRHLTGLGVLTAAAVAIAAGIAAPAAAQGQILGTANPGAIADSYIVIFKDSAATDGHARIQSLTSQLATRHGVRVEHTYEHALRGFAGTMGKAAAQQLAADANVAYVEQNATVRMLGTQPNPPSWGLDRIDQRSLPLNGSYTYPTVASNVRAYVIDTGIRVTHSTFGGRASWGTNTTGDGNDTDCNGHGTHVAGTIGGAEYGVAKGVALTAVKVLDCSGNGSFAGVAAGIDWVTGNHAAGVPAVANMSLGGAGSDITTENAVRNSIADGVVYAIASGNNGADACNFTPARVAEAITVNASTITDARASFSNWGTCTDIFAPGENIVSSSNGSDSATATLSGTSMATPHVAGGAALILADNPALTPAQVAATMFGNATLNAITNPGTGSPNRLLYTGASGPATTVTLNRYWWSGRDHISTTTFPGGSYQFEGSLGQLFTGPVAGTHALYSCKINNDTFTSLSANCEGRVYLGLLGYAYDGPPAGGSRVLFRCVARGSGEHFDSSDPNCEGQGSEGPLGYLLP
ncbi:subtilisin family serine protease [Allocatelliglobosispora scoriae]|uniref:Subtilisin family serine protease n=1 Tax=Allocatelliglobosispora scoriae TaxID=643052 RepID=A0A841BJB5_9ACTN|nr:subtilisin family serine protease [Allocatelliglobosispora scoriae]